MTDNEIVQFLALKLKGWEHIDYPQVQVPGFYKDGEYTGFHLRSWNPLADDSLMVIEAMREKGWGYEIEGHWARKKGHACTFRKYDHEASKGVDGIAWIGGSYKHDDFKRAVCIAAVKALSE